MSAPDKINIAFFWHMHQPWYLWNFTGNAALPWVRLHALKDYYDIPWIAQKCGFPVVINLVPCLVEQIELLASGKATDTFWLVFEKNPSDMTEEELNFVVSNFFSVNRQNFIDSSVRYKELYNLRGATADWRMFSSDDIMDIQMHFVLSWFGETLKEIPEIKELIVKDRNYTETDKELVKKIAQQRLREIIPFYRSLWNEGKISITTSPYYHPILPLLFDISIAKQSNPFTQLPMRPFLEPQDAHKQLVDGITYIERVFGKKPVGVWPSEGSLSEDVITLLISIGVKYVLTDEDILRKSLELSHGERGTFSPRKLYSVHQMYRGGKQISLFFRDKKLSDKIGFEYYNWDTTSAVNDFIASVLRIRSALPANGEFIITIAMDGENAWEYYRKNGFPFLAELYERINKTPEIQPVLLDNFADKRGELLDRLAPGSWINANFDTWCGDKEKNRAWDLLADARHTLKLVKGKVEPEQYEKALRHIMIAEGSDWFWWYGGANYTPYISSFDELFRHHLTMVYRSIGEPIPDELGKPIYDSEKPVEPVRKPLRFMTPSLEGKATNYFEWSSAGFYKAVGICGTMHGVSTLILQKLFYGFDQNVLYLRLDTKKDIKSLLLDGVTFRIMFFKPLRFDIVVRVGDVEVYSEVIERRGGETHRTEIVGAKVVCDEICEMAIPFASIHADADNPIHLVIEVRENDMVHQRFPHIGYIEIIPPGPDFEEQMWYV